jgi:hypothetical protein
MREELIAPCGMNCGICSGYLASKYDVKGKGIKMPYCTGCRPRDKKCTFLKKKCDLLMEGKVWYCYDCENFPCLRLQSIDKRYRTNYRMSMVDNLEFIKEEGIKKFLEQQADRWECPKCGEIICCHNGICFNCGLDKLRKKKKRYRWEDE